MKERMKQKALLNFMCSCSLHFRSSETRMKPYRANTLILKWEREKKLVRIERKGSIKGIYI